MKAERFIYEYANYCIKGWKELMNDCPALGHSGYADKIQERIDNINKYVRARENGLITPTEALMKIADC